MLSTAAVRFLSLSVLFSVLLNPLTVYAWPENPFASKPKLNEDGPIQIDRPQVEVMPHPLSSLSGNQSAPAPLPSTPDERVAYVIPSGENNINAVKSNRVESIQVKFHPSQKCYTRTVFTSEGPSEVTCGAYIDVNKYTANTSESLGQMTYSEYVATKRDLKKTADEVFGPSLSAGSAAAAFAITGVATALFVASISKLAKMEIKFISPLFATIIAAHWNEEVMGMLPEKIAKARPSTYVKITEKLRAMVKRKPGSIIRANPMAIFFVLGEMGYVIRKGYQPLYAASESVTDKLFTDREFAKRLVLSTVLTEVGKSLSSGKPMNLKNVDADESASRLKEASELLEKGQSPEAAFVRPSGDAKMGDNDPAIVGYVHRPDMELVESAFRDFFSKYRQQKVDGAKLEE